MYCLKDMWNTFYSLLSNGEASHWALCLAWAQQFQKDPDQLEGASQGELTEHRRNKKKKMIYTRLWFGVFAYPIFIKLYNARGYKDKQLKIYLKSE